MAASTDGRPLGEATVSLGLTEYEASIAVGALRGHAERWRTTYPGDAEAADALCGVLVAQLPEGWRA